jgi:hypothetical protein
MTGAGSKAVGDHQHVTPSKPRITGPDEPAEAGLCDHCLMIEQLAERSCGANCSPLEDVTVDIDRGRPVRPTHRHSALIVEICKVSNHLVSPKRMFMN